MMPYLPVDRDLLERFGRPLGRHPVMRRGRDLHWSIFAARGVSPETYGDVEQAKQYLKSTFMRMTCCYNDPAASMAAYFEAHLTVFPRRKKATL